MIRHGVDATETITITAVKLTGKNILTQLLTLFVLQLDICSCQLHSKKEDSDYPENDDSKLNSGCKLGVPPIFVLCSFGKNIIKVGPLTNT